MIRARDIMTSAPSTCLADASLRDVARQMVEHDCGMIPVVDEVGRPVGVVTDRDITCRTVAKGESPLERTARDVMTAPCITVRDDSDATRVVDVLERHQIRRVVVVDQDGRCCGVIAQADIARNLLSEKTAEVVREVSRRSAEPRA